MTYTVVFGGRTKRKRFELKIAEAEVISPCSADTDSAVDAFRPEIRYDARSTSDSPDAYYMLFTDKSGKKCVFFFDATSKALKILRFYNPKTVVSKVRY